MEPIKKNFSGYKLYLFTFTGLSILTLLAVWLTHIRIAPVVMVGLIMLIALIQASIVLFFNMHLKFHEKILLVFVGAVFTLIVALIIITLIDYIYR
jgi:caa(3)-type oxidase subunit IV